MAILFAGGEDLDFNQLNGIFWSQSTLANSFRSGISRQSMVIAVAAFAVDTTHYIRGTFTPTTAFWVSFRLNYVASAGALAQAAITPFRLADVNGVVRLQVKFNGAAASPNDTFIVQTVTSGGVTATLGSTSTGRWGSQAATGSPAPVADKIDVFCNYGTSGLVLIYQNGTLVYTSGTANNTAGSGLTALAGFDLGQVAYSTSGGTSTYYTEVLAADEDTRNMTMVTRLATANGNTHNFDGGTAANLAAVSMASGDASPNYSGSAGQIQEYQVTPALPAGTYSVAAVVHKVRATRGATGPSKYDVAVRTGGADFFSSDISPDGAWGTSQTIWAVNPNTGLAWSTAELVNASTAYNFGIKSVT